MMIPKRQFGKNFPRAADDPDQLSFFICEIIRPCYRIRVDRVFPRPFAWLFLLAVLIALGGMAWQVLRPGGDGGQRPPQAAATSGEAFSPPARDEPDRPSGGASSGRPVRVVIDPGHGGNDGGTYVFGLKEKDLVLDLGLRVGRELRKRGIGVALTRERDKWMDLAERVEFAKSHPDAVFVSLHLNRYASAVARGVEAFVHTPGRAIQIPIEGEEKARSFHDERSLELARRLTLGVATECGLRDRGVKESRLLLAREVPAPSVVLECAYLSSPMEARLMSKSVFRQRMAEAIAAELEKFVIARDADPLLGFTEWDDGRAKRKSDLIRASR